MTKWPWSVLGIAQTADSSAIRKAYSARLKELDLDRQIAEYAELRNARDEALWLAKNQPLDDDDFGVGSLDEPREDESGDAFDDVEDPDAYEDEEFLDWHLVDGPARALDFPQGGTLEGYERPDGWDELAGLLFPEGEHSAEGLTVSEADAAERALGQITTWAEAGDISRHAEVDRNLSEMLAGSWPRSAPLVERANEAFHWLGEAGGLDERPAIQFLNARTQGMRFHAAVVDEHHPLNRAWVELSQPGKVSLPGRLRIKHTEIDELLRTIRANFPELESLLNAERVESWQKPGSDIVSRFVQIGFVVFLILQAIRFCAGANDESALDVLPDRPAERAMSEEEVDAVVSELFGDGITAQDMREADPVYSVLLSKDIENRVPARVIVLRLRTSMRRALEWTSRENAVALQELYRGWLAEGLAQSPGQCTTIQWGSYPERPEDIDPALKAEEQALALAMLKAKDFQKLIGTLGTKREANFTVPGRVLERAIAKSGLPEETFRKRFEDVAHLGACEATIAILDVILENPAIIEDDLLRGMW